MRIEECLEKAGILPSDYEGPTTIAFLISQRACELDMETMSLIVYLPQYTRFEKDYMGRLRLMEVLSSLYNIPRDEADIERGEQQRKQISAAIEKDPELRAMVAKLESHYEARTTRGKEEEMPRLPAEVKKFLRELDRRFRER